MRAMATAMLANVCNAINFYDDSEDEFEFAGRWLKGGGRGGGRSSSSRSSFSSYGYSSYGSGGNDCVGDECGEWWVGLLVFGVLVCLISCFYVGIRCFKKCKERMQPGYIPPIDPKNETEMNDMIHRQATWFKNN